VRAAAAVSKAAFASLEVVAHLVQLLNDPGLAGLAGGLALTRFGGCGAVGETAIVAAFAGALLLEVEALALRGAALAALTGRCLLLVALVAVREAALVASRALPIVAELIALGVSFLLAWAAWPALASIFACLSAWPALASIFACLFGLHRVLELAFVAPFARARVAELEAHSPPGVAAAWFDFGRRALVFSRALIAVVAAPTKEVAADLLAAVVTAGVISTVAESAAVAVSAGDIGTKVIALSALTALGLGNLFARGVLILAVVAKTASASVAKRPAHLLIRHLKYKY